MSDDRGLTVEAVQIMVEESINPEVIAFVNGKVTEAAKDGNTTVEGRIRLTDYNFSVIDTEKPNPKEISKLAKALKLYYERRGFKVSIFKDGTGEYNEIDLFWDFQPEQEKVSRV